MKNQSIQEKLQDILQKMVESKAKETRLNCYNEIINIINDFVEGYEQSIEQYYSKQFEMKLEKEKTEKEKAENRYTEFKENLKNEQEKYIERVVNNKVSSGLRLKEKEIVSYQNRCEFLENRLAKLEEIQNNFDEKVLEKVDVETATLQDKLKELEKVNLKWKAMYTSKCEILDRLVRNQLDGE